VVENGGIAGSERCCVNSTRDKQQKGFPDLSQDTSLHTVAEHSTLHSTSTWGVASSDTAGGVEDGPWNWRSRGLQEQHGSSWQEQPKEQKAFDATGTDTDSFPNRDLSVGLVFD
jgi:hypothetical protein